jgi:hypothetical protein
VQPDAYRLQLAQALEVHYVDFTDIFPHLECNGRGASCYMRDDSHVNAATAGIVAEIVQQVLLKMRTAPRVERTYSADHRSFRIVTADPVGTPAVRVDRGNSVLSGNFLRVSQPEQCIFRVADNEFISAIGLNRGVPGANVRNLGSNGSSAKGLTFCADEAASNRFMFIVSDLKFAPRPEAGVVKLEISTPDTALTERTLQWQKPLRGIYGCVEIEYAIAVSDDAVQHEISHSMPDIPFNLVSDDVSQYALDRLVALN